MDERLLRPGEPILLRASADHGQLTDFGWALSTSEGHKWAVRSVRGRKMRGVQSLMDEVGAALQFPLYFGENWDALDECLADMSWLSAEGYTLIVADANQVLCEEPPDGFAGFLELLERIGRGWSLPLEAGCPWDRPATPFHVILHAEAAATRALEDRLRSVSRDVPVLDLGGWARAR